MATTNFRVKINAAQFKAELRKLGKEFEAKAVTAATRTAATVMKKAAIAHAPRLALGTKWRASGQLQKAIYVKKSKRTTSGAIRYYVGVRRGKKEQKKGRDAYYWYFLEHGWIPRGRKGRIKGGERTKARFRRQHAASQIKRPFMAPAFRAAEGEARKKFDSAIRRYLRKANKGRTA